MKYNKKQLKKQFYIAFIFIFLITLVTFITFIRPLNEKINNRVFSYIDFSVKSFMTLSSNAIANDLILNQYESLKGTALELSLIEGVEYIGVFNKNNKVIYENFNESVKNIKFVNEKKDSSFSSYIFRFKHKDVVAFKYDINAIGKKLGSVKLYYSVSDFVLLMNDVRLFVNIFIFVFIFVIFFSISILLNKLVLKPIGKISEQIEDIYNEHKRTDIKIESYNEIGEMASAFNHLSSRNENMFKELEKNNSNLEETVKNRTLQLISHNKKLIKTQDDLNSRINEINALINSTMEALLVFVDDKCTDINYAGIKLFNYENKEDLMNKSIFDFVSEKSSKLLKENIEKKIRNSYELIGLTKDNETFHMLIKEDKFIKNNKEYKIFAIMDLTEVKKSEKALSLNAKMASMGEMLENIAHQWRQPLSTISVAASGMQLQKEFNLLNENEFKSSVSLILENTKLLSQTIDTFRDFFKSEHETILFSLKDTFSKIQQLTSSKYLNQEIEIITNIQDVKLVGLQVELIQIIINILNNSEDAFKTRNIKTKKYIFINIYEKDDFAYIKIKDNALGIKENIIDRIFEPYFTTKHQSLGTGIGLYMSKEIINNQMNGNIYVHNVKYEYMNKEYNGCEFVISLCLKKKTS